MDSTTRQNRPEQLALPIGPPPDLHETFRRVYRRLGIKHLMPTFQVEYRPFAGLRSTLQVRDGNLRVRVSDLLENAPPLVLEALAEILLAQAFQRRPSREARECYLAYVFRPALRQRIDEARRRRGSKRLLPPQGRCHDLEEIFQTLNRRFFQGLLPPPRLGWSLKRSRTVLGHYDSAHATIIVSRVMDRASVPRYLVEYLVYHEMLHMRYPAERQGHRRVLHSREFREAEKEFPKYAQARRALRHAFR